MKRKLWIALCILALAGCTATPETVQTAIAQTQAAENTLTPTLDQGSQVQTGVALTLLASTGTAEALETVIEERIATAVAGTLTALPPPPTATPAETATPTATETRTPQAFPSITNTPEPVIPSGPITLTSLESLGSGQVKLVWEAEGSFVDGLHVVWSTTNPTPAYPNDYWVYFGNGKLRSVVVDVKLANVYFFRVCEYIRSRGTCENYSNAEAIAVN